jgi:hypothetical protein
VVAVVVVVVGAVMVVMMVVIVIAMAMMMVMVDVIMSIMIGWNNSELRGKRGRKGLPEGTRATPQLLLLRIGNFRRLRNGGFGEFKGLGYTQASLFLLRIFGILVTHRI